MVARFEIALWIITVIGKEGRDRVHKVALSIENQNRESKMRMTERNMHP